jgi:hypothetical protein
MEDEVKTAVTCAKLAVTSIVKILVAENWTKA